MLTNNLTLDDEEAVQEEFKELQALTVSSPISQRDITSLDKTLGWTEGGYKTPRRARCGTRPRQDSRCYIIFTAFHGDPWLTAHPRTSSGGASSGAGARSRIGPYSIYPRIFFSTCNIERVLRSLYDAIPLYATPEMKAS